MRKSIGWALEYFKTNKIETFLSFILLLLANVFQKTTIYQKYNEFITHVSNRNLEGAWRLVLFIMGIHIVLFIVQTMYAMYGHYMRPRFMRFYKDKVVSFIMERCEMGCMNIPASTMVNHIVQGPRMGHSMVRHVVMDILPLAVTHIATLGHLLYNYAGLGLWTLVATVLVILFASWFAKRETQFMYNENEYQQRIHAHIDHMMQRLFDIYTQNNAAFEYDKMNELEDDQWTLKQKRLTNIATLQTTVEVISLVFVAGALYFIYKGVRDGHVDTTSAGVMVFQIIFFAQSFSMIGRHILQSHQEYVEMDVINQFILSFPAYAKSSSDLEITKGKIEADVRSFQYTDRSAPMAIKLTIEPHKLTFLTGNSGAGKSTFFRLLLGFYPHYTGTLKIDGLDIREFSPTSLRRHISFVNQTPYIRPESTMDNILYGNPDVHYANHIIMAYAEIQTLLSTLLVDTKCDEMSGGQKQCIGIIRAICRKAPIMLLDEPTSAMNATLAMQMMGLLQRVSRHKTIILITHDRSLFHYAHEVIHL
jgi:ABC-type bacteriocin/lantibiotic exporter with double-glycine peptidase domain